MSLSARALIRTGAVGAALALVAGTVAVVEASQSAASPVPAAQGPYAVASKAPSIGVDDLAGLARSLGLTVTEVNSGLSAAKLAGGSGAAAVAAFARASGGSTAVATRAIEQVFGRSERVGVTGDEAVSVLASRLHVSSGRASAALARLVVLGRQPSGVDPASAEFRAVARDLGVTPQQLAAGVDAVKSSGGK